MNELTRRPLALRADPQTSAFNRVIDAKTPGGEFGTPTHKHANTPALAVLRKSPVENSAQCGAAKTPSHLLAKTRRGEFWQVEHFPKKLSKNAANRFPSRRSSQSSYPVQCLPFWNAICHLPLQNSRIPLGI